MCYRRPEQVVPTTGDETANQIDRERKILEAYLDFRGAMKQSEVLALEVLKAAEGKLEAAKVRVGEAVAVSHLDKLGAKLRVRD